MNEALFILGAFVGSIIGSAMTIWCLVPRHRRR